MLTWSHSATGRSKAMIPITAPPARLTTIIANSRAYRLTAVGRLIAASPVHTVDADGHYGYWLVESACNQPGQAWKPWLLAC